MAAPPPAPPEAEALVRGALGNWLASCLSQPETLTEYSSLWNGNLLHEVVLQIDPEPPHQINKLDGLEDQALMVARVKNFDCIIKNIKALYEEELGQTLLVIPECIILAKTPDSREGVENMKLLILLLLGAAVQCPNKEIFITRIKELDVETQHGIVECIKQVTDNQTLVLTPDSLEFFQSAAMYNHIRRLAKERDQYLSHWANLVITEAVANDDNARLPIKQSAARNNSSSFGTPTSTSFENNHLAVELADWKARLRKQRQELEEKSEHLSECREELEHTKSALNKLRIESQTWFSEARKTAAYRDEVDALRERADRADRLELEVQKYREKLVDMEFYKARESELRDDNRILLETQDMLEEQLAQSRARAEKNRSLEHELMKMKQKENDAALERDIEQQKIQDLIEENTHLNYIIKSTLNSTNVSIDNQGDDLDYCPQGSESGDNSLSEQLTSNAQARALKLELENKRLLSTIDSLKEQSFVDSSEKILDLEKDKKKLTLKCEQLQENCSRLNQQNVELENVFKNALEENRKLQDTIDSQKNSCDRINIERESDRSKIQELEKHVESINSDKQKVNLLCESIKRRAEDLERTLEVKTNEVETLRPIAENAEKVQEKLTIVQTKVASLEKDNSVLTKDVTKLRETIEVKDIALDKFTLQKQHDQKEIVNLNKQVDSMSVQVTKLHDLESQSKELISQTMMDKETIQTLQKNLVEEKVHSERVKVCLEKLGINTVDIIRKEIILEDIVEKIMKNTDIQTIVNDVYIKLKIDPIDGNQMCKCKENSCNKDEPEQMKSNIIAQNEQLSAELSALKDLYNTCQAENAKLQVAVSTLTSQNGSLDSQKLTLQLANSQLAAEKEDLMKQLETVKSIYDNTLQDLHSLRGLHEQLTMEYESIVKEREVLKSLMRDLKLENREMKEESVSFEKQITDLKEEREHLKIESRNLSNLRKEHSKLKEDFRSLFSASDRLKNEYRNLQEEYKNTRTEASQLKLRNTEMSGELSTKTDSMNILELEFNKIAQRCEMLEKMNVTLDSDRRSLMEHMSGLLVQYHELLTHSMEDKQHYHQEEKMLTDKLNNICRQKEKLEEKIMEHYRKLDNCTLKKKSFGSNWVKRVCKAGSDLINKVPSRHNRRSWSVDESSKLTQSQVTLGGSESDESDITNHEVGDANKLDKSGTSASTAEQQMSVSAAPSISSLESPRHSADNFVRKLSHSSFHGSLGGGDDALIRASLRKRQSHKLSSSLVSGHRNSFQGFEGAESPTTVTAALGLCRAGSRRAVYLAEDNTQTNLASPVESELEPKAKESPEKPESSSTFLVYNRISTVIGDGAAQTFAQSPDIRSGDNKLPNHLDTSITKEDKDVKPNSNKTTGKETAIWYEYGCV